MLIGGINTLTLLDYPGKVSCIIFTVGCNFRCGFCHNAQFVLPEEIINFKSKNLIPEEKIIKFLESRKGLLDGVVVSGGEPTLQPDLLEFFKKIKNLGFLVKLDTNGTNYEIVKKAIEQKLIDYVAMDIKNSPSKYEEITGTSVNMSNIENTKNFIIDSGIDHEFRTTVLKKYHSTKEIESIAKFCKGAKKYTIQNFRNTKVLNPDFKTYQGFSKEEMDLLRKSAKKHITNVEIQM